MAARSSRPSAVGAGLAAWLLLWSDSPTAAQPQTKTVEAWNRYVAATEERITRELRATAGFLVTDFRPADRAAADRRALAAGDLRVEEMETRNADGSDIDIPSGSVQHWRGAVLIRGLSLDEMMAALESGDTLRGQKDVIDWRVLERAPGRLRTFLRIRRESVITVTYDTEHDVTVERLADDRAASRSVAARIVEVENAGTPQERAKPPGDDHGFLWRLNAYWRYEETAEGVIAEVESLTLSRNIPVVARPFIGVFVNRIARRSVEDTLAGLAANLSRDRRPRR